MYSDLPEIIVQDLADWLKSKPELVLLDVREAAETQQAPFPDPRVVNAPLSALAHQMQAGLPAAVRPEAEIVVFCHVGARSAQVTAWLKNNLGFPHVYNLRGGIDAYARQVDPTIRTY